MTSFAEFSYFSLWSYISWCFFNSWQLRVARSFPCIATIVIFLVAKLQLSSLQMFSRSAVSESTGCSGLPFDIVITFFFHSKLHSQLMRGLLCSWTDWDFTVYCRKSILILQAFFEFRKVQEQCKNTALGRRLDHGMARDHVCICHRLVQGDCFIIHWSFRIFMCLS